MLKWIKNIFKPKKPDYRLEECFNQDGVKLYTFKDTLRLPSIRRVTLYRYAIDNDMRVDGEDLDTWQNELDTAVASKDMERIRELSISLRSYRNLLQNSKNIFNIASLLLLLPGENPEKIEPEYLKKKQELFECNIHFKSFFLTMGWNCLVSFTAQSIGLLKIEDYLNRKNVKLTEDQFLHIAIQESLKTT